MVLLWVMREEMKPDPINVTKYPAAMNRKSDPACEWFRLRSASIEGIKGDETMRAKKFVKKIVVRKNSGPIFVKDENELLAWASFFAVLIRESVKLSHPGLVFEVESIFRIRGESSPSFFG